MPVEQGCWENSLAHSGCVCLAAIISIDYANEVADINRMIRVLIIYYLGEIDIGDTIVYTAEISELKAAEEQSVRRFLVKLPNNQGGEFLRLWQKFEAAETVES